MKQQTWFITGISSGFGREMTEQLLSSGDRVFGTVRKANTVDDLKRKFGDSLRVAQLDMTDISAIEPVVKAAFEAFTSINVVVSNAGYGLFGAAEGLTSEQIRHQIDTNLMGPIQLTQSVVPRLRSQGGGHIVAISTYGGQTAAPGASLYCASKWGMEGFFDAISGEIAKFNIGVTIIEPGGARTAFRSTARANMGVELDAYKGTPVEMIGTILNNPARLPVGDASKMVKLIIETVKQGYPPKRLVLGSDAYTAIQKALVERLASVEKQKEIAFSTDIPATA